MTRCGRAIEGLRPGNADRGAPDTADWRFSFTPAYRMRGGSFRGFPHLATPADRPEKGDGYCCGKRIHRHPSFMLRITFKRPVGSPPWKSRRYLLLCSTDCHGVRRLPSPGKRRHSLFHAPRNHRRGRPDPGGSAKRLHGASLFVPRLQHGIRSRHSRPSGHPVPGALHRCSSKKCRSDCIPARSTLHRGRISVINLWNSDHNRRPGEGIGAGKSRHQGATGP